jgi:hypothetical protein
MTNRTSPHANTETKRLVEQAVRCNRVWKATGSRAELLAELFRTLKASSQTALLRRRREQTSLRIDPNLPGRIYSVRVNPPIRVDLVGQGSVVRDNAEHLPESVARAWLTHVEIERAIARELSPPAR